MNTNYEVKESPSGVTRIQIGSSNGTLQDKAKQSVETPISTSFKTSRTALERAIELSSKPNDVNINQNKIMVPQPNLNANQKTNIPRPMNSIVHTTSNQQLTTTSKFPIGKVRSATEILLDKSNVYYNEASNNKVLDSNNLPPPPPFLSQNQNQQNVETQGQPRPNSLRSNSISNSNVNNIITHLNNHLNSNSNLNNQNAINNYNSNNVFHYNHQNQNNSHLNNNNEAQQSNNSSKDVILVADYTNNTSMPSRPADTQYYANENKPVQARNKTNLQESHFRMMIDPRYNKRLMRNDEYVQNLVDDNVTSKYMETFYDGKKFWNVIIDDREFDENIVSVDDRENLIKINVSNPNGSLTKTQHPDVAAAEAAEVDVISPSMTRKEMRRNKNLRVRINDDNAMKMNKKSNRDPLKSRNCQKIMFTAILILILLLCIGILVYFFAWNFVMEKYM